MGDLTGKRIDLTYDGLIKTNDEQPIDGTLKALQDGVGNNLPVQVSTTGVNFTGNVTGDNDTTYDLNTTQDGVNVVLELQPDTGSSIDVNLIPGSGITLTTASNRNVEIAATGGGGGVTYDLTVEGVSGTGNVKWVLTGSDGTIDNVIAVAGDNITLSNNAPGQVTLSANNTTYDYGAAGAAGNINFALSGSDASNDVVTMQAGTNITLTDNGSNTFTIDAAGGGGAAGLVNGTALDSLKQADALTTSPAAAEGPQSIALGNGARAIQPATVAIGDGAESTGIGAAALGQYATASGIYSSAWGRTANAAADGAVAFGQQAQAVHPGAVGMGRQVETLFPDTTHVRELMVVAPDGGIGGNGVILLSPNGTAYKLTVDDAGNIVTNPV